MSTSRSPLSKLTREAKNIAKIIKMVERGENPVEDRGGKIAASRASGVFKPAIVMDDKILTFELPWTMIEQTSEVALAAFILKNMREN